MDFIKINGVAIPAPSTFNPSIMDISNAERNANGMMIMEIIAQKQKLELAWDIIAADELKSILNLIDSAFFQVEYPNPKTNKTTTKTMYCGDRTFGMIDYNGGNILYKGFKVNFIER